MTDTPDIFEQILRRGIVPAPDKKAREDALQKAVAEFDRKYAGRLKKASLLDQLAELLRNRNFGRQAYALAGISTLALALFITQTSFPNLESQKGRLEPAARKEMAAMDKSATEAGQRDLSTQLKAQPAPAPQSFAMASRMEARKQSVMAADEPYSRAEASAKAGGQNELALPALAAMAPLPPAREKTAPTPMAAASHVTDSVKAMQVSSASFGVNKASYVYVRASLLNGVLPDPGKVDTNALINAFSYDYELPVSRQMPVAARVILVPAPWNPAHLLLYIAVQSYKAGPGENPVIADDIRMQVVLNPAQLAEYHRIGGARSNSNEAEAEIGAGQALAALYEITPPPAAPASPPVAMLGTATIRYQLADESEGRFVQLPVDGRAILPSIAESAENMHFAVAVAAFGELLKHNAALGTYSYDNVIALARSGLGADASGERAEFVRLAGIARNLASSPASSLPVHTDH